MKPVIRAVIDVGTNSVKLLVAEISGRGITPLDEESHQTRLGQGLYESHRLQPESIARTAAAVAEFAAKARSYQADLIRVIATSAARDAINAAELVGAIERDSGLKAQIISGEQEADWVYRGVCTNPTLAREGLLLLDIGGGSAEFIVGHAGRKDFSASYQLGTVRLLEQLRPGDPPLASELANCRKFIREFLSKNVQPSLTAFLSSPVALAPGSGNAEAVAELKLVGTGGTASILGCMEARLETFDRKRLEATRLSQERLRWHVEHLWDMPLSNRKEVVGLPKNRADVILTGVAIYEAVAELFGFRELRLSTRGLRFAALLGES
jgi:exopolyphosphatase/guanosine-5'-triphosphate,3'-diphosphate pyrophosphatase